MIESPIVLENSGAEIRNCTLSLETAEPLQFLDLTDLVAEIVEEAGIRHGLVNVQTRHTTTAIIINENEPLLLDDMKNTLERLAPQAQPYRHNDFSIRTHNLEPDERQNGHSHCKAMFLRTSETLNIASGRIQLGPWQRIFLIELDGPRNRTVSVTTIGKVE